MKTTVSKKMPHAHFAPRAALISLFLLGVLLASGVAFGKNGGLNYLLDTTVPTRLWAVGVGLKYGLTVMADAALIWAAAYFARHDYKVSAALHFWLLAVLTGLGLLLLTWVRSTVSASAVYGVFLPITRNAQPLITGTIIFLLLQPQLRRLLARPTGRMLGLLILSLPLIFNQDIFLLKNGNSLLGVFALACAGLVAGGAGPRLRRGWLILPLAYLLTLLMGLNIALGGSGLLANAPRFIGTLSPLTIVPAIWLVQFLRSWSEPQDAGHAVHWLNRSSAFSIWIGALLLNGATWVDIFTNQYAVLQRIFPSLGRRWLVLPVVLGGVIAVGLAMLLSFIAPRTRLWGEMAKWGQADLMASLHRVRHHSCDLAQQLWRQYWQPLSATGLLLLAQFGGTLAMNQSLRTVENIGNTRANIFAFTLTSVFPNQLYGTVILLMLFALLLAFTQRYWLALLTTLTIQVAVVGANVTKIHLRGQPIVPSDLAEVRSLSELMGMLNPVMVVAALIAIVLVIALIVYLEHGSQPIRQHWQARTTTILVAAAFLGSLGTLNTSGSYMANAALSLNVYMSDNNPLRFAQLNGPAVQFISGMNGKTMTAPRGYSRASVERVVKKYQQLAATTNQQRPNSLKNTTVIFNLSESFADPTRIPGLSFAKDPMPNIRKLKQATTSGSMISYGYGGGTANMEYMTLTGMAVGSYDTSMSTPYIQLVPKLKWNPNIGQNFNYASSIHPYTGSFYNRIQVYKDFGFDKFVYNGSKYSIIDKRKLGNSPYYSDSTTYANALKQVRARQGGQFINLISIQNHMPYNNWYKNQIKVTAKNTLSDYKAHIETYATGVAYTDQAVAAFRTALDKLNRSVVWVFYGDHLPGIYGKSAAGVLYHQTDYFVYANRYAREHGAVMKQSGGSFVGPNDFIALALKQAGVKLDGYNALLTALEQNVPAIWNRTGSSNTNVTDGMRFVGSAGNVMSYQQLSAKQKQILHDYQLIQYDITSGKQYSKKLHFHTDILK